MHIKYFWRILVGIIILGWTYVWIYDSVMMYKNPNKTLGYVISAESEITKCTEDTCNIKYRFVMKSKADNSDLIISAREEPIIYTDSVIDSPKPLIVSDSIIEHGYKPNNKFDVWNRIGNYLFVTGFLVILLIGGFKSVLR